MSDFNVLTIKEMIKRRDRFRLDSHHQGPKELPLWEKQRVIAQIQLGLPLAEIFFREVTGDDGKPFYMVLRGWGQLQAIWDFADNKFPTWTDVQMEQWAREERRKLK